MSVIKSRECSKEVIYELSKHSGYSSYQIEQVVESVFEFINKEIKRGSRDAIRLPKLGSLQISKKREMNEIHNIPNGILEIKNKMGFYTNVNEIRVQEILDRYKDEFSKNR